MLFLFCYHFSQTLDVNKKLNCCTGILLECFDQLKTVASNKEGLLYGVPVSIKDNIQYKVFSGDEVAQLLSDSKYSTLTGFPSMCETYCNFNIAQV